MNMGHVLQPPICKVNISCYKAMLNIFILNLSWENIQKSLGSKDL